MKICINKSVISKSIDGKEVILHVETGVYHELNESGSLIWSLIKNNIFSKDELVAKLKLRYENDLIDINLDDLNEFLDDLNESKLIEFH